MKFRIHFGKLVPILAMPILVGAGAGSALAADPSWSLKAAADRAGDALPIGAPPAVTTSVSGTGSTARKVQQLSAHFSTDRAGDAPLIGAPSVTRAPVTSAPSREHGARVSLAAFGTDRAGDATPIGALWRVDHQQGQMAERAGDKTVN